MSHSQLGARFGNQSYPDMVVFHIKREPVEEPDDIDICYHHPEDLYPDVSIRDILENSQQEQSLTGKGHRFACLRCDCTYTRRCHLQRHERYECGIPPALRRLECDVCGYRTSRKSSIIRHIQRVHCGQSAGSFARVVVPRELGPASAFPCGSCAKSYAAQAMLDKHRAIECGRNEDFLDDWLKTAATMPAPFAQGKATVAKQEPKSADPAINPEEALKIYNEAIAGPDASRLRCPKCSQFFTRKDSLRRHLMKACSPKACVRSQSSIAPAPAGQRSRSYGVSSKPRVACDRCSRTYATKHGLKQHKELTCDQPPKLACEHCPYLARLKHHLASHIANNHPGGGSLTKPPNMWRPFPCPVCSKSYKYKTDLARHVRFSCGQNPVFACPRCPRRYRHQFGLDRHVGLECGVEPAHACPHCPYRAKRPFSLLSHVRKRHPEAARAS